MATLVLGSQRVAADTGPYLICEIGVNHEGSLDIAKRLIDQVAEGGGHAAKFQTYKAETLASKHSPAYWDTNSEPTDSQFALFKRHDLFNEQEYVALAEHCLTAGVDFISTPFDASAVEVLDPLVPFFKIASADLTNVPLLRQIAGKKKPVVLSTGASTIGEIDLALAELAEHGANEVALLHCVLNYPTPYEHAHLNMIKGLARAYPDFVIGYSDHTLPDPGMTILTSAVALGARVVEKHFTHDKTLPGNDHYHAMDIGDLKRLTANLQLLQPAFGETAKRPLDSEQISRDNARRSLVLSRDVAANQIIDETMLIPKRPGTGISPLMFDNVFGMRAVRDLPADHVLQWWDIHSAERLD